MKRLAVIAFFTAFGLWGAMTLGWPHGLDQGLYSWVGSVILDGGVPYKDAWEIKGPMTYLPNALAQALLGHNEWGIRLLDLMLLCASMAVAYRLVTRLSNRFGGACAAIIFWGLYGGTGHWHTAQPDGWFAMLLVMVVAVAARQDFAQSLRWPCLAGLLVGVSALLKPPYAVFLAPVLVLVLQRNGWRWRASARPLCAAVLSFIVPVLAVLAWLGLHEGGLGAFAEIQFRFNPSVYAAEQSGAQWKALSLFVLYTPAILAGVPVFVLGLVALFQRDRALGVLFAFCMGLAVLSVVLQAKYFSYHWHPVRAVYAVVCGVGLGALMDFWHQARQSQHDRTITTRLGALVWTIAVLIVALCLRRPARDVVKWGTAVAGLRPWKVYYQQVGGPGKGDASYLAIKEAAAYLAEHTNKDERVLVWGFNVLMNYLADRPSPSRFGYNLAFTRRSRHPFLEPYQRELVGDLRATPPTYIVMSDQDQHALMARSSKDFLGDFAELKAFVDGNYRLEATVAGYEMWRRVK